MDSGYGRLADIPIVDAHIHLWDLDANYYPWLAEGNHSTAIKDYSSLRRNYLVADFHRDIGDLNVLGCVHIQAQHDPSDHVRETRWLQSVADSAGSRGMPQAIVGNADLASADIERVLDGHRAFGNMRGIRQSLNRRLSEHPPYDPLRDAAWTRNFPLLAKYDLSFDMELVPGQAETAAALIRRHPDVQIVFTHAGIPFKRDAESMEQWRRAIALYATLPNTAIKLSGFGIPDPGWTAGTIAPIVATVVDAFTPARCMLATNFPVEGIAKRYRAIWEEYFVLFSGYSRAEIDMIFSGNARKYYRF